MQIRAKNCNIKIFLVPTLIFSILVSLFICGQAPNILLFAQEKTDRMQNLRERLNKLKKAPENEGEEVESAEPAPVPEQKYSRKKEQIEKLAGMIYVPEGEFIMGTDGGFDYESPKHLINLEGFYIDKYEVTNYQYKRFIDVTGYKAPEYWEKNEFPEDKGHHPVVKVSYYDAEAYAKWSGKRLPTEQEWEKAARYTDARQFPWGNEWNKELANIRKVLWLGKTKPVGSYPDGCSPYGIYDLSGNVAEWTSSFFKPYVGNIEPNKNYGESYKVVRGGSCGKSRVMAQAFRRDFLSPSDTKRDVGFRCAK